MSAELNSYKNEIRSTNYNFRVVVFFIFVTIIITIASKTY
ncbi:hypothetical protein GGR22_001348 [Flavobacterium gossypii]|uniref:Uncharacterized protein n=1 Tax=Flavobacterium gossypii TaxID=1646119 RepID=A0ABR6DNF8_9FLAO|nr:hypothetical protein [Flavobacterium gossypii]